VHVGQLRQTALRRQIFFDLPHDFPRRIDLFLWRAVAQPNI